MDLYHFPFLLDAGRLPRRPTGYDSIRQKRWLGLSHLRATRPAPSLVLIGRPGIGKIILSDQMVRIEPARERSSPMRVSANRFAKVARRAVDQLKTIASFIAAHKDITNGKNDNAWPAIANNNDLRSLRDEIRSAPASIATMQEDPNIAALTASFRLRNWVTAG